MLLSRLSPALPTPAALTIPGPILALSGLSLTARLVLAEAYARTCAGRPVSLHNYQYARRVGYPIDRIQQALRELERAGYVVRHYTRPPVRCRRLAFTFPTGCSARLNPQLSVLPRAGAAG